jgi:hypothetical protein
MSEERDETRQIDDRSRLTDEARTLVEKQAADLRAAKVPIATEPPTVFRP